LQTPLQLRVPVGQAQLPLSQVAPVGHLVPQPPQLSTSVLVSMQAFPHLTRGSLQTSSQRPELHVRLGPHLFPQRPQWSSLLSRFWQTPLQLVNPALQQTPPMQLPPSPQLPLLSPHIPVPG
jgi:hypothetical protein